MVDVGSTFLPASTPFGDVNFVVQDLREETGGNEMQTSGAGLNLIKSFEGCRLQAYQDSGGVWTIGYGHTNGVLPGQTITQQQAEEFLKQDLKNAEKYVGQYDHIYHFKQYQFDALVSFTYNAGAGNLKKLLNAGVKPFRS